MELSRPISRRDLLRMGARVGLGLATFDMLAGCSVDKEEDLLYPSMPEKWDLVHEKKKLFLIRNEPRNIDQDYLKKLFGILEQNSSHNRKLQASAVRNSLSWIQLENKWGSTAFMIDESGYYVTAAHTFNDSLENSFIPISSPALVYHFQTGMAIPVRSYLVHEKYDLAIFYAPNNNAPKPILNLNINTEMPSNGQDLWLYAFLNNSSPNKYLLTLRGRVIDKEKPLNETDHILTGLKVEGIKPFAGASGGPVIDNQGKIIGIESGAYPSPVNNRNNYKGAIVESMNLVSEITRNGRKYRLATTNTF